MSPLYTNSWAPAHKEIIDIGGSTLDTTFDAQLTNAFKGEGYFPKEVAYTTGMQHWCEIANTSYQTTDELEIIESTAFDVVNDMPATANHVNKSAADFPQITCIGLGGNFIQGDKYFATLPKPPIFLSLGSIFFNAPDQMCVDRCLEFLKHLSGSPHSKLIVGQDGPSGTEASSTHAAYQTKAYDAFFTSYLQGIQTHADIDANPRVAWSYESKLDNSMHYFKVVAQQDMVCHRYNDFFNQKGTTYTMFPSWKRGEVEIHGIAKSQCLDIKTLGKAPNSGMRQYLIQPRI
ncbi:4-dimethylallyltryptophan n-methyltransferase [Fusarium sp. NRRL 52700]|nr:4-dimethylallyltryptophan n-methyltransferase [Fusarium sp. NRRL 52700]